MKKKTYQPSAAELDILQAIWELQPVTVRAVYERISAKKDVGYTTVLKQIQRLTEKGVLKKTGGEGGAHLYSSNVPEAGVKRQLAGNVLQSAFGGSALQMVLHALGDDQPSSEELHALRAWLDAQEARQNQSGGADEPSTSKGTPDKNDKS